MADKSIIVSKEGKITIVTLNRPDRHNVIDEGMLDDLAIAVRDISNDKNCRVVVIEGAGDKAFCAGVDINKLSTLSDEKEIGKFVDKLHTLFDSIQNLDQPVIAAVNGYCFGGGCELALACDMRLATTAAKFGQPEVAVGILPGAGGTYRLPKAVGIAKAKEMILTGDPISAEEAFQFRLVNKVVEPSSLRKEAIDLANRILKNSSSAVKLAKKASNSTLKLTEEEEKGYFIECFAYPDAHEGLRAFLEHRKPKFA